MPLSEYRYSAHVTNDLTFNKQLNKVGRGRCKGGGGVIDSNIWIQKYVFQRFRLPYGFAYGFAYGFWQTGLPYRFEIWIQTLQFSKMLKFSSLAPPALAYSSTHR